MPSLDPAHARVVVRVVIGEMAMSRREVAGEPAGVQLIEACREPHEVVLRGEGDDELSILITDAPVDPERLAERLDGMSGSLEQGSMLGHLGGRQVAEDLESGRAVTLKVWELLADLADAPFEVIRRATIHPDLDRWPAIDLIDRHFDESESPGGEQHDEHGDAHARVVGWTHRELDGLRSILRTRSPAGFKCAVGRSDTSDVGCGMATIERCSDARRRRRLSFALSALLTTVAIAAGPRLDGGPPHPARWESVDGPRVPVAGAAGVMLERGPALIGGFTDRLEATAAIQVRDPRHGWMPVGSSLLEPRAEPSAVPLTDGTVLVVGGWDGRLPDDVRHLGTAERLDPWNPATRNSVPPPFADRIDAGLDGHAACLLADGRVLVVHGRRGTVFDPASDAWSAPFRISCERRHPALVELPSELNGAAEVVVIGGARRPDDPAVETLRIEPDGTVISTPWPASVMPSTVGRSAAIRVGRSIIVAGGELEGRSIGSTWRLVPAEHTATPGADLPIAHGVAAGRLIRTGARLVLLGGESIVGGRPVPIEFGAVLHPRLERIWSLPAAPVASVRSSVLGGESSSPEVVGGYRFDGTAARGARTRVLSDDVRLRLPSLLIDD